jgi:hypothetical protein
MPPMIRAVLVLQMALARDVDWFIALCDRPIRRFFLRLEGLNFLTTNDDDVMHGSGARVGSERSVIDIRGSHKILSLNMGGPWLIPEMLKRPEIPISAAAERELPVRL